MAHIVLDLRLICTAAEDYANPIEPSGEGGRKIAGAIAYALGLTDEPRVASHVYSRRRPGQQHP